MLSKNQQAKLKKRKRLDYLYVSSDINEKYITRFLEQQQLKYTKQEWKRLASASTKVWRHALRHYTDYNEAVDGWSQKKERQHFYSLFDIAHSLLRYYGEMRDTLDADEFRVKRRMRYSDKLTYGVYKHDPKDKHGNAIGTPQNKLGIIIGKHLYVVGERESNGMPKAIKLTKHQVKRVRRYNTRADLFDQFPRFKKKEAELDTLEQFYR